MAALDGSSVDFLVLKRDIEASCKEHLPAGSEAKVDIAIRLPMGPTLVDIKIVKVRE